MSGRPALHLVASASDKILWRKGGARSARRAGLYTTGAACQVTLPLLIGEANPYGGNPYFALYPEPEGCSGHRLCHLVLGFEYAKTYLRAFDRRNLCPRDWSMRVARREAVRLYSIPNFQAVLLGRKVAAAFRLENVPPFTVHLPWGENFPNRWMVLLPHPSGLCREWNGPVAFLRARELVQSVYPYDLLY